MPKISAICRAAGAGVAVMALAGSAQAVTVFGLTTDNNLFSFDSSTPGTIATGTYITGLQQNEVVLGIDFRPSTNTLYAVGSSSRIYTLNLTTGAAAAVGGVFTPAVNGTSFDIDFNPTVDRIRFVSDADQNLRLNPDIGAVAAVDGAITYGTSVNPNVVGAAYTNNFPGATSTTLYTIDSGTDTLNMQNPPNNGTQVTVGSLGLDTSALVGFDILSSGGDTAYASLTPATDSVSRFYTINLATGVASGGTLIGGGLAVRDIAVLTPEPASLSLLGLAGAGLLARRRRA